MHWVLSECIFYNPSLITLYQFWTLNNKRQVNKVKCVHQSGMNRDVPKQGRCCSCLRCECSPHRGGIRIPTGITC